MSGMDIETDASVNPWICVAMLCKNRSHITYTVFGGDVKHCSMQSNVAIE